MKESLIEKEFISYTEALALKELGFDNKEYLNFIFVDKNNKFYTSDLVPDNAIWSPTYSQSLRWFRDIHYMSFLISDSFFWIMGKGNFNTISYEEAELKCLKKLIEIIKK